MGSIYKRRSVFWIQYYRDGRQFRESSRSRKETDAKRLLRLREGDIERGVPVTPRIGRLTFAEATEAIITDYKVNGYKTLDDAERRIKLHLSPVFGGRRMIGITASDATAYAVRRLETGASPGEVNRELSLLKRMFTLAVDDGKLLTAPKIALLPEDNVRTGFFEREQFAGLRSHLTPAVQAVVTFAYITGWRIASEVLPLQWRNVDLEAGTVRLDPGTTKNGEGRVIFLTADLRTLLQGQKTLHDALKQKGVICPWVFHRNGKRIRSIRQIWASAAKRAGCPGRIPHDLRRTAVRNLVRAGVPERVSMTITGHKTRSVFERYNIVSASDLEDAARRLDESMSTIPGTGGELVLPSAAGQSR